MASATKNSVLSSILFKDVKKKKSKVLDSELDDIFRNSAGASTHIPPAPHQAEPDSKRKIDETKGSVPAPKRRKVAPPTTPSLPKPPAKKAPKKDQDASSSDIDEDEDDPALEDRYLSRRNQTQAAKTPSKTPSKNTEDVESIDATHESDNEEETTLVHESLAKQPIKRDSKKGINYVKPNETEDEKNRRTIFVGNLPLDIAKSKPGKHALIKHIKDKVEGCKVQSVRFRSVAFKKPSEPLPKEDEEESKAAETLTARKQRDAERVSQWQAEHQTDEPPPKAYLKPSDKKRVAFIKQEFHEEASSVNAYVVFAYANPQRSENIPDILDPFVAVEQAITACDGTVFMERTIRVDRVSSKGSLPAPSTTAASDMRLTVFVGNLDFTAKEEDLRTFFQQLVEKHVESKSDDGEGYIKHVRIVRDNSTQLGKGFAYVEFKDRSVVDEVLAMEQEKLKFAKRKLRVQRCKTLPGSTLPKVAPQPAPNSQRHGPNASKQSGHSRHPQQAAPIPKGDPRLGEKLKELGKEERKAVKSSDPNRIARRLAKKKARNTLGRQGVEVKGKEKSKDTKRRPSARSSKPQSKGQRSQKAV